MAQGLGSFFRKGAYQSRVAIQGPSSTYTILFFLLILIFLIENLTAVGSQPAVVEVPTSSNDSERDTCSPTPLGGSNKLGMSSGWSSTFETEAVVDAVDGSSCNDQADTAGPLPSPQERLSPRIPKKTQAPSFGTLLRDYSVQGRKRFEPPVYVDGAVPTQPKQVQSSQVHVQLFLTIFG